MQEWEPDGFFISNGPGDPDPLHSAQQVAKEIIKHNLLCSAFVWDIKSLL